MYFKELEGLGFTPREIKVYVALLELGESSASKIIKTSEVPGSKIYETLDKLKKRGIVSSIVRSNKQFFKAAPPSMLLARLENQRNQLATKVVPALTELENKEKDNREATLYEGIGGLRLIYSLMLKVLKKDETIFAMGIPKTGLELLEPVITHFNTQRVRKGIKLKILYTPELKEVGKKRKKLKHTKVRYLNKEAAAPAWIDIFGEYIAIFDAESTSVVLIKNKNIAASFKQNFDNAWKTAKL